MSCIHKISSTYNSEPALHWCQKSSIPSPAVNVPLIVVCSSFCLCLPVDAHEHCTQAGQPTGNNKLIFGCSLRKQCVMAARGVRPGFLCDHCVSQSCRCVVLLAFVGELTLLVCACAFDGFLALVPACICRPTIASLCNTRPAASPQTTCYSHELTTSTVPINQRIMIHEFPSPQPWKHNCQESPTHSALCCHSNSAANAVGV